MIAALLVLLSVYFAIRAAMVELFQNLQSAYRKWEEKAQPKIGSTLYNNNSTTNTNNGGVTPFDAAGGDHQLENEGSWDDSASKRQLMGHAKLQRRISPSSALMGQGPHPAGGGGGGGMGMGPTAWSQRATRNKFRMPTLNLPQWDRLAHFKTAPVVTMEMGPLRPVMGTCCAKCVPTSRLAFHDDPSLTLGVHNVLSVSSQNREHGIVIRTFHNLAFLIRRGMTYLYPDVSYKVLKCERVGQAIDRAVEDEIFEKEIDREELEVLQLEMLKQKHTKRAIETLRRMRSCISSALLRLAGWVLYKLLGRILTGIHVQKGNIENLRKIGKRNLPIIYLPLHRSHLDYILITFILYINDLKAPVIAAGDNLLIPFFGALMRGLGAFFIKRKLDTHTGRKDHVYRAVLHSYMVESLKANHSLEFFIEGGRSRTGKACMPKAGLLSVVVDSILDGSVEDAFIVPVGISYEKILDGNFVLEQLGKPKTVENFTSAVYAIWSTLHSNFGSVRVDFCHPYSIKEFLQAAKKRHHIGGPLVRVPAYSALEVNQETPLRRKSSTTSLYGLDIVSEDNRDVIRDLANHIIFDASNASALMSTNLLAFLLLTKHRKGGTLKQLNQSMSWLKDDLSSRQRDVGFSGETTDAIRHACALFGKELVTTETVQMEWSSMEATEASNVKITFYKPITRLPHVLELQYYANSVLSAYLLESVVVNAIFAELDEELEPWRGCKSQVSISCNNVVQKSLDLCDILQYEFVFAPPCTDLSSVIIDTIQSLVTKELLTPSESSMGVGGDKRSWANRLESLDFGSSDEDDGLMVPRDHLFKVNLSEESFQKLQFLRCILSPFIESYWVSACSLIKLVHIQKEESLFFKDIQKTAEERLHKGLLTYEESFAAEPLKNSLRLFERWNVLENHFQDSVKLVYLQTEYDNEDNIQMVVKRIEDFRK